MSRVWWDEPGSAAVLAYDKPVLIPGGRQAEIDALVGRIAGFVPEWRDLTEEDAGVALVRLFGLQLEPVLARVGRLPDKLLREFLSSAGVTLAPPRAAQAQVRFTPVERNTSPVELPEGFRLGSVRADGEKGDVVWETDEALTIANCTLEEIRVFNGSLTLEAEAGEPFALFGERPVVGAALYLGFAGVGELAGTLALAITPHYDGPVAPVAAGAGYVPPRQNARLVWEILTSQSFVALDVERDDSAQFTRSGIIRLAIPRDCTAGRPEQVGEGEDRFWLRLRLASGALTTQPRVESIVPHVVAVTAQETWRAEFPVPDRDSLGSFVKLTRTPVLPGSVVLEVDEGAAAAGLFDMPDTVSPGDQGTFRRWTEVETLAGLDGDARVFTLDSASGVIRFGDNRNGAEPLPGIRNIAVRAYATTTGSAANVAAGEISKMLSTASGIDRVENPEPARGGTDAESVDSAQVRGPEEIKARGRAVTAADVELLAQEAEGADIVRAFALSGVDPAYPGARIPGTIGLLVIPRRHPSEPPGAPLYADGPTLEAIAGHVADECGPLGSRVSVGNPRYHEVGVEGTLVLTAGADAEGVLSAVRAALDLWLNPENTDPAFGWWKVGATLRHADLSHLVLAAHEAIVSAPYLAFRVDGVRHEACDNVPLSRFGLPWPERHRLLAEFEEEDL